MKREDRKTSDFITKAVYVLGVLDNNKKYHYDVLLNIFSEYICHVYVRSDCLTGLVIADHEYPQRVAHTLINKVCYGELNESQSFNKSAGGHL